MKFELRSGSLLMLDVEVIVASANNDLILGGGVTGEIRRTAGPTVLEECEAIGTIPLGQVAVTGAGELSFKHVFHAAVKPIGLFADERSIRNAIRNCYREAAKREITSIGFPAVGSGGGGFPIEKAVRILIEETMRASREPGCPERVVLSVADEKTMEIVEPLVRERVPAEILSAVVRTPAAPVSSQLKGKAKEEAKAKPESPPPPKKEAPKIDPPSFGRT